MKKILSTKFLGESKGMNLIILYLFTLLVVLLGTSKSIFSVYMPDDYLLASRQMPLSFYLNQGRFIQAITTAWFNYSNINIISASGIFTPVFIILIAAAASLFVFILSDKRTSLIIKCLLSGVIACHPAFSMMAVYHMSTMLFSICMVSFCLYMYLFDEFSSLNNYKTLGLLTLLVVVMCGTYQPFFVVIIIFTTSHILITNNFRLTFQKMMKVAPVITGFVLYIIIFKATKNLAGHNDWDNRAGLVSDVVGRIHEVVLFIPSLFFSDWWLISWQFNMLLTIGMILFFTTFFFDKERSNILLRILFSVFVFAITILPIAILKDWDPSSRAMFSVSFSYVAVMLAFFNLQIKKVKCFIISLVILLGLISSNSYLYTVEINQKNDEALVHVVYGMLKGKDLTDKKLTIVNDKSIKVASWALNGIFYFNTGENFNISSPDSVDIQLCHNQKIRPVLIDNNNKVVICLY